MTWSRDGERLAIETVMTRERRAHCVRSGHLSQAVAEDRRRRIVIPAVTRQRDRSASLVAPGSTPPPS
jgi:hypothetical protein